MLLDASAVLALLNREPGWEAVQDWVPGAPISAVNLAEVIGKLCDAGLPYADACAAVEFLGLSVVEFDADMARNRADCAPLHALRDCHWEIAPVSRRPFGSVRRC